MAKIQKVSTEVKSAILRKSAYSLPNNPTDSGYKADDIRKAFYKPIIDATNSALTEIDRIVNELNATIKNQTEQVDFVTSVQGVNYHGSDGFIYSYKDGVFSVTKYTGDAEVLLIPSEVCYSGKNYPVKTIKEKAFNGCAFTRVEIPASIETIESNAFLNCSELKEVKFWGYTQHIYEKLSGNIDFFVPKKYLSYYENIFLSKTNRIFTFDTIESLVEDISKKITKSSTPGIVYGTTDDGAISTQSEISYDSEVIGNSLVRRTYDGYFDVADPVQEKHPVNKKYADTFGASVDFSIDQDYVLTLVLKDKNGKPLSQKAVDLPIESLVKNASYGDGKLTLAFQSGDTVDIDVSSLTKGLVGEDKFKSELNKRLYLEEPSGVQTDYVTIVKDSYNSYYQHLMRAVATPTVNNNYGAWQGVLRRSQGEICAQTPYTGNNYDLINREFLKSELSKIGTFKWVDFSATIQRKKVYAVMVGIGQTAHEDGSYRFAMPPVFVYANDSNVIEYFHYNYDFYLEDYFKTGGKGSFHLNTSGTGYSKTVTLYNQTMADGASWDWDVCEIIKMLIKE